MLEVGNITKTTLTAGQAIPFTTVFYNTNNKTTFDSNNNALVINRTGYYNAGGSFIIQPTTAGVFTVSMYVNGALEPTAVAGFTADGTSEYTFNIPSKYIQTKASPSGNVQITFIPSGEGTLTNANAFVYYLPSICE